MRLRVVKTRVLRKVLLDIGFEEETGRDHIFYFYKHREKLVVRTKVSHGVSELRQPILGLIGKQLHLNRDQFEDLLEGKLSASIYNDILRGNSVIE